MMMGMRSLRWLVLPSVLAVSFTALGTETTGTKKTAAAKAAPKTKLDVPKIDLSGLATIPKGDGITARRVETEELAPRFGDAEVVKYEVVGIGHARAFTHGAKGLVPVGGMLRSITLTGSPLATQPFATVVRVRSTQKGDAPIEIVILDPAGDTALSGSGLVRFKTAGANQDWQIDWDPTPRPKSGTYQVLVRVGGKPLGTWPLEVVAEKK
jgi:hypothetical protein